MRIRSARIDDLPAIYRICHETGMPPIGEERNPELLGHVYAGPYVVGPSTRSVVVVDDEGVAGYLLCATDTEAFERWQDKHWWPGLREDLPLDLPGRSASDQEVVDLIHEPPRAPRWIVERYPAHLHIDLLPRLQGAGWGPRLISGLLDDLHASEIVAQAKDLWAVVAADGALSRKNPAAASAGKLGTGEYEVVFDRDVTACAYNVTLGSTDTTEAPAGEAGASQRAGNAKAVAVVTRDSGGTKADRPFHLTVNC